MSLRGVVRVQIPLYPAVLRVSSGYGSSARKVAVKARSTL